jgi:hypothetical protein
MIMIKNLCRSLLFRALFSLLCLFYSGKMHAQIITGFSPTNLSAGTGSVLTINGSGFGTDGASANKYIGFRSSSTANLIIGAYYPDYISWTDNQIVLRVRSDAGTGPVYLVIGGAIVSTLPGLTIRYDMINAIFNNIPFPLNLVNSNSSGGYTFQLFTNFNSNIAANQSFSRALNTWKCATNVNWSIGSPTSTSVVSDDGINIIRFGNSSELNAGELGITQSFYRTVDQSRWELTGMDILFIDSTYNWNFGPAAPAFTQFDFESVALHELGHAHSLQHVIDNNDVMNMSLANGTLRRTLNSNNIDAGEYAMSISTAHANSYFFPPMTALPNGSCNVFVPIINSFSPTTGTTGSVITIKGKYLTGVNSVTFGTTSAQSFSGVTDTSITAVVAGGSTGSINITTPSGLATIAGFVFQSKQTISFSPLATVIYGSADIVPGATSTNNTIPITYISSNAAVATITAAGNIHVTGAGNTTITASQAGNANYIAAIPVSQSLNVSQAALTITANNQTKTYGSSNPPLTVNYIGFVNGEAPANLTTQPSVGTIATVGSPVNNYPITVGGAASANYTFIYVGGTLKINPATLIITANNQTRVYGTTNPTLTINYAGFVNGEAAANLVTPPSASTTATSGSPVNAYPITVGGGVSSNYTFSYVGGILTVLPADLTITADNKSKNFGDVNPPLTMSFNGFVNGETQSSLSMPATLSTTATTQSAVGTYPITVSGATDANYIIHYVAGILVINPASSPSITTISPDTAPSGTAVTISGSNFINVSSVSFGGTPANSFVVNSPTSITAVVGAGASGSVNVTTPTGTGIISGFTFIFNLPVTNFKVSNISSTCRGDNNGIINIVANQSLSYTATITGNGMNASYPFTTSLDIDNLSPGTYSVCIGVVGHPDFQQCYSIVNSEPQPLSVDVKVKEFDNTIMLSLSGSDQYNIALNGKTFTTGNSTIDLPLQAGNNDLEVTTDKPCQGSFEKIINFSSITKPYPNPFEHLLNLNIGNEVVKNVVIEILSMEGRLVFFKKFTNQYGVLTLELGNLDRGLYVLRLTEENSKRTFKIVKQ